MALLCLAIVGKSNEPLYISDILSATQREEEKKDDCRDFFGFSDAAANDSLSIRHELMMHAALDRMEEIFGIQSRGNNRSTSNSKWVGLLCPLEETFIYGYVTATNIKFMAMVADNNGEPVAEAHLKTMFVSICCCHRPIYYNNRIVSYGLTSFYSSDVHLTFNLLHLQINVHNLYVEHTLNPFSQLQQKVKSKRFDQRIHQVVDEYHANKGIAYA